MKTGLMTEIAMRMEMAKQTSLMRTEMILKEGLTAMKSLVRAT